jgi:hypothetical protein
MDLNLLKKTAPHDWPVSVGAVLLEILSDSLARLSDRLLATELAGDFTVITNQIAEALLSLLMNTNEASELRGMAAISLGPALEYADTDGFDDLVEDQITEEEFHNIQKSLHRLYLNADEDPGVRRRILEASVRSPQDWHQNAIREAFACEDDAWRLTAVFSMRWVRGFDQQILDALESDNEGIHYQAVCAAGNWEVDGAWSHMARIICTPAIDKPLMLAAIDAVASIRPDDAGVVLGNLIDSDDEDIVDAAQEAIAMADNIASLESEDEADFDDDARPH